MAAPRVDPVPDRPAAVVDTGEGRALAFADYHAGLEVALRHQGVELRSRAAERREAVLRLLVETDADRVVVLGDLANAIGEPRGEEFEELEMLLATLAERVPVTVTKGNHDGNLDAAVERMAVDGVDVAEGPGARVGDVGFAHGHTWPAPAVLSAPVVCTAHEHPVVRLADEVGGTRTERAWLRGKLNPEPFEAHHGRSFPGGDLVVFPAFNDLTGGTWVNEDDEFLSPFLPEGLTDGEAFLLDGTRLGDYRRV